MGKIDNTALFKISYGLYVVTTNDGVRDNGLIVNTVIQVTDSPLQVAVTVNKANYSHDIIKNTGKLNVNCLTVDTPFELFKRFGFASGRDKDKFEGMECFRTENGLTILPQYINAYMSLEVKEYADLGSHGMFICSVTESSSVSDAESITYSYYHKNTKPKPEPVNKKGYVCKICGYVYEGENLPEDFICPWCKHGVSDFEEIK